MSSDVFDKVEQKDIGIGIRWRIRSHGNPSHKLTEDDVFDILMPLFRPPMTWGKE
jgi:hypothetical protein